MPVLENQFEYWNRVANDKEFTHPLDYDLVSTHFDKKHKVLDYGCGYGRITGELHDRGYHRIVGVDTSLELINRGTTRYPHLGLRHIDDVTALDQVGNDFDAAILFAVLTCIPNNDGQCELIQKLRSVLRPGGLLYISDYYLQHDKQEAGKYGFLDDNPQNYGVFTLPEGVTFRHHPREWVMTLLGDFDIIVENGISVTTMNGHAAIAFQILARR